MLRNYRKSTYTGGARLTALLLVVLAVWGLTSCQPGKIPPDTTDGTGIDTTVPPVTDDPVQEEVKLVNTVFTSALLKGDIPGPFEDSGETVYITMGVPEGMGGGYREFAAQSNAVAERTGFSLIYAEDLIAFNSKYLAIQTTESTLSTLRPDLADEGFTLMDSEKLTLEDGRALSVFYTFVKEGNGGRYEAYCYLLAEDGMTVFPFVCRFEGFTAFRDAEVRARVREIAATVTVHEDNFAIQLADGLVSRNFSLYDNLPDGYSVADIVPYTEDLLAVFARDKAKALYVSFFNYITNTLEGGWQRIYDNAAACDVFAAENGLIVSPSYGKYYSVTGAPDSLKIQLITRTFSDALYSDDGNYRAYVQAAGGNVIVEDLSTGTSTVVYSPRTESVTAGEERRAELICFSKDDRLIFRIDGPAGTVGFGVFNTASNAVSAYENGLAPIGCTATAVWLMRYRDGQPVEICRAELDTPDKTESMYVRGGERKEGFFDNYEDIFFESRITLNSSGTYFVLFPADDASRISLFSAHTFKCIYTTPVPHISEVISLDKQIIVGTQGWGNLYTIDLPEKTTPGGSFDHESVKETPNYEPDYEEVLELIRYSAPYLYRPAKGASSFASGNIIYYLLNYAAEKGLGEEYTDYVKIMVEKPAEDITADAVSTDGTPEAPAETADAETTSSETDDVTVSVETTAEVPEDTDTATGEITDEVTDGVTAEPITTGPEMIEQIIEVQRYRVPIYTLKKLAWELLGITEDYFEDRITDPVPEIPEETVTGVETTDIPEDSDTVDTNDATPDGTAAPTDVTEVPAETVAPEEPDEPEEKKPENAYIGLEGEDRYDRETGLFHFIPGSDTPSGWSIETGGTVIAHNTNKLTVKTVLVAPDGTRMNAEYSLEAVNDYYRITAISVSVSLNVRDNLPRFELDGVKYAPLWYAVEKGPGKLYYAINDSPAGGNITPVLRDGKGYEYRNGELVFGDVYLYGSKAVISVSRFGVHDILYVDMASGETRLLSGKTGFNGYSAEIAAMQKAGSSYPYYGARLLGASANDSRILYLVSDGVNKLSAKYYALDLATGKTQKLSQSLYGSRTSANNIEFFQWISSSRVRISVWETVNYSLQNNVYEWTYTGGVWNAVKTDYTTDGLGWYGSGGSQIVDPEDEEETREVTEDEYSAWSDESGWNGEGITLRELADLFYAARDEEIAKRDGYSFNGTSEYVITFRSSGYIVMTQRSVLYNSEGKPAGITKNTQNICQIVNGEWKWIRITLP